MSTEPALLGPGQVLALGPLAAAGLRRLHEPWHRRLLGALVSALPLLLMLLLALGTWWLVKNSPGPPGPPAATAQRLEPDYTMSGFAIERFNADGSLKIRLEGAQMHHYPATDRIEIEDVRIRAIAADGRITLARARRAVATGDGSELQLLGGAEVNSQDASGAALVMRGNFLHIYLVTERVTSNQPVVVLRGATEVRAGGLRYDHVTQKLDLDGPARLQLPARAR